MRNFLKGLTLLLSLTTLIPIWRSHYRWVRIWDFPRLQIAISACINILVVVALRNKLPSKIRRLLLASNAFVALFQAFKIFRYTPLYPVEAVKSRKLNLPARFSFMVSNVKMDNRESEPYLRLVRNVDPDLLLINEPDGWWEERLRELDAKYPQHVKIPQGNTYGMILYSRLPLIEPNIQFLVRDYIPSIHTLVALPSGQQVELYCVHPEPPNEARTHFRDGELLIIGRKVSESKLPCVVAGDLNDVAWSKSTRLFQKVSRMVDPRIGRGFYNTFNAHNPLIRYPLDHVFYSPSLSLVELKRLPGFGSDHFPILVRLEYDPEAALRQAPPEKDRKDKKRANRVLKKIHASRQ